MTLGRLAVWIGGAVFFAAYVALVAWPLMVRDFAYVAQWWLR